ncbi:ATP-grasp domain-containing protein [Yoonia sp. BS5-3]|uniref:ATP-grasp domain-containing protein n=1 Tax=Yoonia phaeophyticola TaxID=3137369 RepID=A0ABZ2V3U6_9RHOB
MRRILITGARAPAALHLARLFHGAGHHVVMADSLHHVVSRVSRACAAYVKLPAANGDRAVYAEAIRKALSDHQIDLVIPTCEEVLHLAAVWQDGGITVPLFAPEFGVLSRAHDKHRFTQMAASFGLAVPETRLLQSEADVALLRDRAAQFVFKPVWSRFATDVLICPEEATIAPTSARPWVAQDFVAGEEVSVYAVADKGKMMTWSAYRSPYRAGKGAGIAFLRDDDPAIGAFVNRFIGRSGWHGQVSFDLIRKPDGGLVALECNPRATSGVHFFRQPAAFAAACLDGVPVRPEVQGLQAVKAAMWVYGPWQAPRRFWRDIKALQDVMVWPDDPAPARQQWLASWEILKLALRHHISPAEATTLDIAWDG